MDVIVNITSSQRKGLVFHAKGYSYHKNSKRPINNVDGAHAIMFILSVPIQTEAVEQELLVISQPIIAFQILSLHRNTS